MRKALIIIAVVVFCTPLVASAAPIMPSFSTVPTGWVTDRFQPSAFANVGTYQGRDDVLGITITSAGAFGSRPAGYNSTFYNTQGMQYALTGGAGDWLSADLFIESAWSNETLGTVRSDMWGVMSGGSALVYPIIGFTNYGGTPRYRLWDADTATGWVNLAAAVQFGQWNSFAILFTGTSFDYYLNQQLVYSDTTIGGATNFSAVIMQAYNFGGDPSLGAVNPVDYTAHWDNTVVPEPASLLLFGTGLVGLAKLRKRRR